MSWFVSSAPGKYDIHGNMDPLLEAQFEILFGDEEPPVKPGPNPERAAWQAARNTFAGITTPDGVPPEALQAAVDMFLSYGFTEPIFYQLTNGRVLARFTTNPVDVNPDAASVIASPGAGIAAMQTNRIKRGEYFPRLHFMVPGKYVQMNEANKQKVALP